MVGWFRHTKKFTPIDIHAYSEYAFQLSCGEGHLEIAKWLIDVVDKGIQKNFMPINIHADDEYAFRVSCGNGHLEIAKWLDEGT